jgi:DNA-binding NtrC family response regulator
VRQAFPSIDFIVMTPPERAGEAVEAVKAGAANYVTYPLNADEIRYVTESLHEGIRAQSELDYLRDRFWQSDAMEVVQTRNPDMKGFSTRYASCAHQKHGSVAEKRNGQGGAAKLIHRSQHRGGCSYRRALRRHPTPS